MTLRKFPLVSSLSLRIFYHQLLQLPSDNLLPVVSSCHQHCVATWCLLPACGLIYGLLTCFVCLFFSPLFFSSSCIKHCRVSCCCQHAHGKKHSCNFSLTAKCFFSCLCYYFIIPDATFIFIHARIVLFVFLMPDQYVVGWGNLAV